MSSNSNNTTEQQYFKLSKDMTWEILSYLINGQVLESRNSSVLAMELSIHLPCTFLLMQCSEDLFTNKLWAADSKLKPNLHRVFWTN